MDEFCCRRSPVQLCISPGKKEKRSLLSKREVMKVKAHMEAGFQFPRQTCNIYLIEKTLSLKSTVKLR